MTENLKNPLFELLRADGYIHVSKALKFAIGNNEAEIYSELLSRYTYFSERDDLTEDGYFFNTIEDLYSGTNLTAFQQRNAIATLKDIGLISVKLQGIPPTRFFKINNEPKLLTKLLIEGKERAENARKATKNHKYKETSPMYVNKLHTNKNNNNSAAVLAKEILSVPPQVNKRKPLKIVADLVNESGWLVPKGKPRPKQSPKSATPQPLVQNATMGK